MDTDDFGEKIGDSDGNSIVISKKFVHGYPSEFIGRILQASFDVLKDVMDILYESLILYFQRYIQTQLGTKFNTSK
jgi:hypothetical protein